MGQKIIPISLRLNKEKNWHSQWLVEKQEYSNILHFDLELRKYLENLLNKQHIQILKININKISNNIYIYVFLSKNNIKLKSILKEKIKLLYYLNLYLNNQYHIKIFFLKTYFKLFLYQEKNALILKKIKRNIRYNSKLKKIIYTFNFALLTGKVNMISKILKQELIKKKYHKGYLNFINKLLSNFFYMKPKLLGYKLQVKGRINGARRKRKLKFQKGKVPLNTLKNNIKYSFDEFKTKSGICSIKLWFYFKDITKQRLIPETKAAETLRLNKEAEIQLKNSNFKQKKKIKRVLPKDNTYDIERFNVIMKEHHRKEALKNKKKK